MDASAPSRPRRRFAALGTAFFMYLVLGAIVSIAARWPAQFGGRGDAERVLAEFVSRGAALTAPLPVLIVFAGVLLLARQPDRWGAVGVVTGMILSVVFLIGSLGEALAPATPDVPRAVLVASGVIGSGFAVALFAAGVPAVRSSSRVEPRTSP